MYHASGPAGLTLNFKSYKGVVLSAAAVAGRKWLPVMTVIAPGGGVQPCVQQSRTCADYKHDRPAIMVSVTDTVERLTTSMIEEHTWARGFEKKRA